MSIVRTSRNLRDIPEEKHAPEGEYDLRIYKVTTGESDAGRNTVKCMIEIEGTGSENYQPVTHVLIEPSEADWENDKDMATRFLRNTKRFLTLFGVTYNDDDGSYDTDELENARGRGRLTVEPIEKGPRKGDLVNRLQVPRIRE